MIYTKKEEKLLLTNTSFMKSEFSTIYYLIPSVREEQKLLVLKRILDKLLKLELLLTNTISIIRTLIENLSKEDNGPT